MNHLADEKSPYLLQHRRNPVDWYPWGEEAFARAREEEKPIFLSIGYSTCYWCHIMEKESFEHADVAAVLNRDFVSIKLDREERPDVDSIYMNAVVSLTGRGGWPMSVFLTPEREPFYGGTYFPKEQFLILLAKISEAWKQQRQAVAQTSRQLTEMIRTEAPPPNMRSVDERLLSLAFDQIGSRFDEREGGFGPAPKFPASFTIMLLLRGYLRTGEEHLLEMATLTLDKMACGGIYDQLGGGFHRYSTDATWLVPHFEKMLYDNAQLALVYLEAYQLTARDLYAEVARETLEYVLRDMEAPDGAFYAAEDAGEVGKEGEFYVWSEDELVQLLSPSELEELKTVFGTSAKGNFEGKNILRVSNASNWGKRQSPLLKTARAKLLRERAKRQRPHLDDKILTSWNGLMIAALARGFEVLAEEKFLAGATRAASFIQKELQGKAKLKRRYRDGEAKIDATLEDYSFLIFGLLHLAEASGDMKWMNWTLSLQEELDEKLWDQKRGGYFRASPEDSTLIARQKEFTDGAEPSGNGIALLNLLKLGELTFDPAITKRAEALLLALPNTFEKFPSAFTAALLALDFQTDIAKQVVILGKLASEEAKTFDRLLARHFIPNKVLVRSEQSVEGGPEIIEGKKILNGKTTFYVCERGQCSAPTNAPEEALKLMKEKKPFRL